MSEPATSGTGSESGTGAVTGGHGFLGLIVRLTGGAFLSKILGLVREIGMALIIGTAAVADSFRVAITAVLLPIAIFQNESVPAIIIPMQAEALKRGEAPRRLAALSIALVFVTALITIGMLWASHLMLDLMVSGFSEDQRAMTASFVQVMAFAMPASVLLNCLSAGEIAIGLTRVTNARAATINVSILAALVVIAMGGSFHLLAWSFTAAFNALGIGYGLLLWREGNLSFTAVGLREILVTGREFFTRLLPFFPMPFAEQANVWIERMAASRLMTGSVASLDYARTLTESFFLLISQPVGLAVLSDSGRSQSMEDQAMSLTRHVIALALPVCGFLFVFSDEVVRILFQRGAFNETSVLLTSQAIRGISLGLWASTLGWILLRLLYRSGRSLAAAAVLIASYCANIGYNWTMMSMAGDAAIGTFEIGIGEAIRSYMLLFGVLLFLKGGGRLLVPVALALIPTAAMVVVGLGIETLSAGPFVRLVAGSLTLLAVLVASGLLLVRPTLVGLVARLRRAPAET